MALGASLVGAVRARLCLAGSHRPGIAQPGNPEQAVSSLQAWPRCGQQSGSRHHTSVGAHHRELWGSKCDARAD